MNPNTLFLILGGGALLYWWSTKQAAPTSRPSAGTQAATATTPQPTSPAPQPGNVTTSPQPKPPGPTPTPLPVTPASTLTGIYAALVAEMKLHPDVYSGGKINADFSTFNWYLAKVSGLTDLPDFFTATGGSTDPNIPFDVDTYWGIMAPWLKAHRSLSGLGAYEAADWRIQRSPYLGPGGWRA